VVLRFSDTLRWGAAATWLFLALMLAMLVTAAAGVRRRAPRTLVVHG
jgi:hypothetical protein